ncbi:hypothetical protein ABID19_006727 [Mesorhizobium robiniae]|uniref:Uncharacterized protein n=1 Tax=Mesorhizobium robiniae TaxID=559315 RepID=A0ABV2GZE2_9HYPH
MQSKITDLVEMATFEHLNSLGTPEPNVMRLITKNFATHPQSMGPCQKLLVIRSIVATAYHCASGMALLSLSAQSAHG